MNNAATRYISKKDCICGAGRTSATLVGHIGNSASEAPVFYGLAANVLNNICVACRGCGRNRSAELIRGKVSHKHVCGAKCLASKGPTCECSCGGKNHGASYNVEGAR